MLLIIALYIFDFPVGWITPWSSQHVTGREENEVKMKVLAN